MYLVTTDCCVHLIYCSSYPEPWEDAETRTSNSGLQYSYGVDYGTLGWIYFLDPPAAPGPVAHATVLENKVVPNRLPHNPTGRLQFSSFLGSLWLGTKLPKRELHWSPQVLTKSVDLLGSSMFSVEVRWHTHPATEVTEASPVKCSPT